MAAEVSAEITLELSRFRRNVRSVINTFQGMNKSISGGGRALAGGMFSGIKGAAAKAASAVKSVFSGIGPGIGVAIGMQMMRSLMGALAPLKQQLSAMFAGAAADEQLGVSFKTLLGGLEPAKKLISGLKEFGATTPFQFLQDLAPAARTLLAFGESADNVVDVLRRVGDVASGVNTPLGLLAIQYGKARAQGVLMWEDLKIFVEKGVPLMRVFADQLKVPESAIKGLASKGKISFEMLQKAFIDLTSKGGTYFNMMKEQSLTWSGLISTLKDNWTELLINFGRPIQDALKPLLSQAIVLVNEFREKSVDLGKAFGETVAAGVAKVLPMLQKMNTLIPAIGNMFRTVNWGEMRELITLAMTSAFKRAVNFLGKGLQGVLSAALTNLLVSLQQLPEVFAHLTSPGFWEGVRKIMKSIGSALGTAMLTSVKGIMDALAAFSPKILGKRSAAGKAAIDASIADQESAANRQSKEGSGTVDLLLRQLNERLGAVGSSFVDGFKGGSNIFSTEKEDSRIKEIVGGMKNNLSASKAAVEAANNARRISSERAARRNKARGDGAAEEETTAAGAGPASFTSGGPRMRGFDREIGALYGRSPQEALAAEAKQQTNILKTIAANTQQTADTRPPVGGANTILSFS